MNHQAVDAEAASLVDQIVVSLLQLEGDIDAFLINAMRDQLAFADVPSMAHLTFRGKLDALQDVVAARWAGRQDHATFSAWLAAMETYRLKRNALVNGAWAFAHGETTNVAPGLAGRVRQEEMRYTRAELAEELKKAKGLAMAFDAWKRAATS